MLTRRTFVKASGAALAGTWLAGGRSIAPGAGAVRRANAVSQLGDVQASAECIEVLVQDTNNFRTRDKLDGFDGDDILRGLDGDDTIEGGEGADVLFGGLGADILLGGADDDRLEGGAGTDTLTGGTGRDVFVFRDGDTAATWVDADVVTDFDQGANERLRLDAMDADTTAGGIQAFSFIGAGAFTGVAGQLHYVQSGGMTYVEGDTDGDSNADFVIALTGTLDLVAGDFVL